MTVLAVSMDPSGAEIVTDTEAYYTDGEFAFMGSKTYALPEYDLVFVSHGLAAIGFRLYVEAKGNTTINDFDTFMARGTESAMKAARQLRQEFEGDNETAIEQIDKAEIMVVGYSADLGRFAAGILSGGSGFQGKVTNHEHFAFGSSANGMERAMEALGRRPKGPQEMLMTLGMVSLQARDEHELILAGGNIVHTEITQGGVFQKRIGTLQEAEIAARDYRQSQEPVKRDEPKVGRNDPCPCGSGQKAKRCCGAH